MPRFQYRFETLLRLYEEARDDARRRLAEARQASDILDERLVALRTQRAEARAADTTRRQGAISVDALLDQGRYDLVLEMREREIHHQQGQIGQEIERRAQRLLLAEQEYRKFEKLKEIAQAEHHQNEMRAWQQELDELASRKTNPVWGDSQ